MYGKKVGMEEDTRIQLPYIYCITCVVIDSLGGDCNLRGQ